MEDALTAHSSFLENTRLRVLIFGHKEFSQLMSNELQAFTQKAEFKIHDAIVGSVAEITPLIEDYQPDVVVSAGSNAAYLKTTLSLPVLSMQVTEQDVIRAVERAAQVTDKIAVIGFNEPSPILPILAENLNIQVKEYSYNTADQAREFFHLAAKQQGVAIVGASLVCGMASMRQVPSFIVYSAASCRRTIKQALEAATQYRAQKRERALNDWLLTQSKTPIIMVDEAGQSITVNHAAQTELDLGSRPGDQLQSLIEEAGRHSATDGVCYVNGIEWWYHRDQVPNSPQFVYQLYRKKQALAKKKIKPSKLIYESDAIEALMEQVRAFSASPSNVLINGESGTGKELIARAIKEHSPYHEGEFVALNCSAIPSALFEGELFGHQEGAFTGAKRGGRRGLVEVAQGGVLFLDEISELALDQQAKLLRFLQERSFRPLGSNSERPVDLKLVAASNKSLKDLVDAGKFREDLYFRLNVFNIHIPPLRMRGEDISVIAEHKLKVFAQHYKLDLPIDSLVDAIAPALHNYSWPGNVRELENILERLVASLLVQPDVHQAESILRKIAPEIFVEAKLDKQQGFLRSKELEIVADAMIKFDGNKQKSCRVSGNESNHLVAATQTHKSQVMGNQHVNILTVARC